MLATRFGWHAAQLVEQRQWGRMVALKGSDIGSVAIEEVAGKNRRVPLDHPLLLAARGVGVSLGTAPA